MVGLPPDEIGTHGSTNPLNIADPPLQPIITHQQTLRFGFSPNQDTITLDGMNEVGQVSGGGGQGFPLQNFRSYNWSAEFRVV